MKTDYTHTSPVKVFIGCMALILSKLKLFERFGIYRHINITDCETISMSRTPGEENKVPTKVLGNRQTRTTDAIIKFLREAGEASTPTIHEYLNDHTRSKLRYGCSKGRLNNLLGKMVEFEVCGEVYLPAPCYYSVKVWRLAGWV